MRVLTYHLHAHTLGPIAKEEEPLRHTMNNHLEGIATLDMHLHAVALDFAPQGYPWITPGNRLRDVGRSVGTGKKPTACIVRNRPDGCLHVYLGGAEVVAAAMIRLFFILSSFLLTARRESGLRFRSDVFNVMAGTEALGLPDCVRPISTLPL